MRKKITRQNSANYAHFWKWQLSKHKILIFYTVRPAVADIDDPSRKKINFLVGKKFGKQKISVRKNFR